MPSVTDIDAQRKLDETISEHEGRISELEEKVFEHKAAILALRTQRNAHSAVSKLPAEVMANIFVHAKRYAPEYVVDNGNWLNVSGVCRQWRAIVLDTAGLWCYVDLSWPAERALEILKRSKSLPLRVRCKYYRSRSEPVAKAVLLHLQRIRKLVVEFASTRSLTAFLTLSSSGSVPTLEVLKLTSLQGNTLQGRLWHDMPALRVLELCDIRFISQLPMLPHLTRLVVKCMPMNPASGLSALWLIKSLQNTPAIEEIDVSEIGTEMPPSVYPQISLPKLTSLRMQTPLLDISKIFDHIDYPSSTVIDFHCCSESTPDALVDLSSLERVCSRFASGSSASYQVRLESTGNLGNNLCMRLMPLDESPSSHLTLSVPGPSESSQTVMKYVRLGSTLPLESVRKLELIGFDIKRMPIAEWFTLFPLLSQLGTLRLTDCGADILVGLLSTGNAGKPPLEKLETLIMNCCSFSLNLNRRCDKLCDTMISVLRDRKKHNMAIRKLRIELCHITKDVISDFGRYAEIDWDGIGIEKFMEYGWTGAE